MPASSSRVLWAAGISTVVALLVEHVIWFLVRSQSIGQALEYVSVPLLMGLVAGVLSGLLAATGNRLARDKPAAIRYFIVAILAALGAVLGTFFFPAMFLFKWFTVPVIAVIVAGGVLLLARDRRRASTGSAGLDTLDPQ